MGSYQMGIDEVGIDKVGINQSVFQGSFSVFIYQFEEALAYRLAWIRRNYRFLKDWNNPMRMNCMRCRIPENIVNNVVCALFAQSDSRVQSLKHYVIITSSL